MARTINPGGLEQLILIAILRLGDNAYGVTVQQEIGTRTNREIATSAIYIVLDRLLKKGYLTSVLGEKTEERGGRAKRYFKVSATGERALRDSLTTTLKMVGELEPWADGV